jgi:hypothetical protein
MGHWPLSHPSYPAPPPEACPSVGLLSALHLLLSELRLVCWERMGCWDCVGVEVVGVVVMGLLRGLLFPC